MLGQQGPVRHQQADAQLDRVGATDQIMRNDEGEDVGYIVEGGPRA